MNHTVRNILRKSFPFIAVAVLACSETDETPHTQLDKYLVPEVARVVESGTSADFRDFVKTNGSVPIIAAYGALREIAFSDSAETRVILEPFLDHIAQFMSDQYQCHYFLEDLALRRSMDKTRVQALADITSRVNATLADGEASEDDRISRLVSMVDEIDNLEIREASANFRVALALQLDRAGHSKRAVHYRRDAFFTYKDIGYHERVSQLAGALGGYYEVAGMPDSMSYFYDTGLELASSHDMAYHQARLLSFYAFHYRRTGRIARAQEHISDALEIYAAYDGGIHELRFVLSAAKFYRFLGCAEISERMLQRADFLLRDLEKRQIDASSYFRLQLQAARALHRLKKGERAEAERDLNQVLDAYANTTSPEQPAQILYDWAMVLIRQSLFSEALLLVDRGIELCGAPQLASMKPSFVLRRAESLLGIGDLAGALSALQEFESTGAQYTTRPREEWVTRDVISARIAMALGGHDAGMAALSRAVERLVAQLAFMDVGTERHLWLSERIDLRRLISDLAGEDDTVAYGAELFWRTLAFGQVYDAGQPLEDQWRGLAEETVRRLHQAGASHVLYAIDGPVITRYIIDEQTLERAQLPTEADAFREVVARAWRLLSTDPGHGSATMSDDLVRVLKQLGDIALGDVEFNEGRPVYFTSDGFLSAIPFEALDIGSDVYEPLLEHHEIVYLHGGALPASRRARPTRSLIVANPKLSPSVQRRLSVDSNLEAAEKEAAVALSLLVNPTLLAGADATHDAVLERWEQSSVIYVAAHVLQDREVPFLTLLPLAANDADNNSFASASTNSSTGSFIDVEDVLGATLDACELVVLSGCATGAPYVATTSAAPGFGDAFLDAGAAQVVQTFWEVRDQMAFEAMRLFLTHYGVDQDASRALTDMRRELRASYPHPFYWASYAIKLREP